MIDAQLRSLRRRWRLAAPECRPGGSARAGDGVCVDVDVYRRGPFGGGSNSAIINNGIVSGEGKIARRVPRFATVELEDGYDVSNDK